MLNIVVKEDELLDDSQLLKGILEGCVLYIISKGEIYGYKIISELESKGFDNLPEGTLYPILTRLDKKGAITCTRKKSPVGPIRKYYSITENGLKYLEEFRINYKTLTNTVKCVFEQDNNEDNNTEE